MHYDGNAIFALHSESRQHRADARHGIVQLRIADGVRRIHEGCLVAAAFGNVAVDEVDSCVVIALNIHGSAACVHNDQPYRDRFLDLNQKRIRTRNAGAARFGGFAAAFSDYCEAAISGIPATSCQLAWGRQYQYKEGVADAN